MADLRCRECGRTATYADANIADVRRDYCDEATDPAGAPTTCDWVKA